MFFLCRRLLVQFTQQQNSKVEKDWSNVGVSLKAKCQPSGSRLQEVRGRPVHLARDQRCWSTVGLAFSAAVTPTQPLAESQPGSVYLHIKSAAAALGTASLRRSTIRNMKCTLDSVVDADHMLIPGGFGRLSSLRPGAELFSDTPGRSTLFETLWWIFQKNVFFLLASWALRLSVGLLHIYSSINSFSPRCFISSVERKKSFPGVSSSSFLWHTATLRLKVKNGISVSGGSPALWTIQRQMSALLFF